MKKPEPPRGVTSFAWFLLAFIPLVLILTLLVSLSLLNVISPGIATVLGAFVTIGGFFLAALEPLSKRPNYTKSVNQAIGVLVYMAKVIRYWLLRLMSRWMRANIWSKSWTALLVIMLCITVFAAIFREPLVRRLNPNAPVSLTPLIFSLKTENGLIGISDGRYAFDMVDRNSSGFTGPRNTYFKQKAADDFMMNDYEQAKADWARALEGEGSNDAEVRIYREDQRVVNSGKPYVTFIVITQLTGSHEEYKAGREDLQGYYIAQSEFNNGSHPFWMRLLIANIGDQEQYAQPLSINGHQETPVQIVTERIISSGKDDPTFRGILGWPERSHKIDDMMNALCRVNIPIVTVSANDVVDQEACSYFSVAPSIYSQVLTSSLYIKSILKKKRIAIIYDPANAYSLSLYTNLLSVFPNQSQGTAIIDREPYSLYSKNTLPGLVRAILRGKPDLIYFAGYPTDLDAVLQSLNVFQSSGNVDIMAANIVYQSPHFPSAQQIGKRHLYFTAFAYPDEWHILHQAQPGFNQEYIDAYNNKLHPPGTYNYNRANDTVMIAYDALKTVTTALSVFKDNRFSLDALQNALENSFYEGITGLIAYQQDTQSQQENARNKPVVVIQFTAQGYNRFKGINGCYTANERGCYDIQTTGTA